MKTWAQNVLISPTNWKFLVFGLALVLMMIFRPEGILPARGAKEDAPDGDEGTGGVAGGVAGGVTGGGASSVAAKELRP